VAYSVLDNNQEIMHRMAIALLERETIDANEIRMIIEGKELPPLKPSGGGTPATGDVQQVLKPEPNRGGGLPEGSPSPA
jgi:cell division protease FtsH